MELTIVKMEPTGTEKKWNTQEYLAMGGRVRCHKAVEILAPSHGRIKWIAKLARLTPNSNKELQTKYKNVPWG